MNYKLNQGIPEKNFFKRNYIDVLELLTPSVYFSEDINLSGLELSVLDLVLDSHINIAKNINSIFNVSHVNAGVDFSSFSGVSQYFIKQNGLTNITTQEFETKILDPLGKSLKDFKNESEFRSYIEQTLLPNIRLNSPNYSFDTTSAPEAHGYLLNNLSWMYILNTSGNANLVVQPSTLVANRLVECVYYAKPITLNLAIQDVTEYIWKNYNVCSLFQNNLIPPTFLSSTGKYVSGTQQLDKLHTLIDVLYSPLMSDAKDTRVKDAFQLYISVNKFSPETERAGPFSKFLKAMSYSVYDVDDQINKINLLYDIDRCPDELLPRVADLIGWELYGANPEKWRVQLKNAIRIYKAKGTKKALNLVLESQFGETSFDLSSQIQELYESYIPNLLYYCLVTESPVLSGFDSWTFAKSQSLGIQNYSFDSMDTNIRFVVDSILKRAFNLYPQNFFIGPKPFEVTDLYSYRGTINNIPPWELEKYYRYCKLDIRLLNYFVERLLCFGVPEYVVEGFRNLISSNTLQSTSDLSVHNGWIVFTSGIQYPPNKQNILLNFRKDKAKYLPLWSGKSSSFSLQLAASSFDFDKYSTDLFSSEGLKGIFRSIYEYTPAHAIPLLRVKLDDSDLADYIEYSCPEIAYNTSSDLFTPSTLFAGFGSFGSDMTALGRTFGRTQVDQPSEFGTTKLSDLTRSAVRRRNHKNLLPKSGWYDRTGFNMPGYLAPSSFKNYNSYLPLGYIPSANKFTPVTGYSNWLYDEISSITIPSVYDSCENFLSQNVYNGVYTSTTFPCRGGSALDESQCLRYATRGDCDPIIPLIFNKFLERGLQDAGDLLEEQGLDQFGLTPLVYNVEQSLSNSSLDTKPNSKTDFFDFEFGKGVHDLYLDYIKKFGYHDLSRDTERDNGGFNVFAHTFGPTIFNGMLTVEGSAAQNWITSSFNSEVRIDNYFGSGVLSLSGVASGTYVASDVSTLYIGTYEFRNPHILSGVELISPSGTSVENFFSVYKIDPQFETEEHEDFAIDNTLIKLNTKANTTGVHRVKFNLDKYGTSPNKLIPEHAFEINIPYFVGRKSNTQYGGGGIRVWIHTEPENGYVWSWTPDFKWRIDAVADLTPLYVQNTLAHPSYYDLTETDLISVGSPCAETTQAALSLRNIKSSYFKTHSIYFDTNNRPICIPNYYNEGQQVHRLDQKYSIELFAIPDFTNQSYVYIDNVNTVDLTLSQYASGYTEEEIQKIFLYFRNVALNTASRVANTTSSIFGASGGSRLEYRNKPEFETVTAGSFSNYTKIEFTQ